MALFAIIGQQGSSIEKLLAAVTTVFPHDNWQVNDKAWIVVGIGTAKEISDRLGVSGGANGTAVVVQLTGDYFGYASTQLWAWMKSKIEASNRG